MRSIISLGLRPTAVRSAVALMLLLVVPTAGAWAAGPQAERLASASAALPDAASRARIVEAYGRLPLTFEPDRPRSGGPVRFLARGAGFALALTPAEALLAIVRAPAGDGGSESGPAALVHMRLLGADPAPRLEGIDPQEAMVSELLGARPREWRTGIETYGRVLYREPYPGVDLVFRGDQRRLEYDFVVSAGADPATIALGVEGVRGLAVDPSGDLVLATAAGELRWEPPRLYQDVGGLRREVRGGYVLTGPCRFGFAIGSYDATRPLVIDPVLAWSTFVGGSDLDEGRAIAVDDEGHAYVAGITTSVDYPTVTPSLGAHSSGNDAFVTKLSTDGSGLVFSTYLGGSGDEEANGLAVDGEGNVYLGGVTSSADFPTANGFAASLAGAADAFVAVLGPRGDDLRYATYLGGSVGFLDGVDTVSDLALDTANKVYITGISTADDFPATQGAAQLTHGGSEDAYVAKLDPSAAGAASLVYATKLGASGLERGVSIAVDGVGNAYVAGRTNSLDFPVTPSAFRPEPLGGPPDFPTLDAFVTELSADGSKLLYSTYLGGSAADLGYAIAVDPSDVGLAFVTGHTYSSDFPMTAGSFDATLDGPSDAFLVVLHTAREADASLLSSTYLGGSADDVGFGIAVGPGSDLVVTGATSSSDFPVTPDAFQGAYGGGALDAYVARLSPTLAEPPSFSSYLGGPGEDRGLGVAVDASGDAFLTGFSEPVGLPTTADAFDHEGGSGHDAFAAKVAWAPSTQTPTTTN